MRAISIRVLLVSLMLAPATVWPQGETALEEIIVTAQRREQNIQDIPISVTAFTGESIQRANINDAGGYMRLVPNVSFDYASQLGGSRGLNMAIRGVGNNNTDEAAFIQSVGVYLDEFSVASVANATVNPQLYDLERVEVLRGPQGTYYGRNAVGGALNLTTRKPADEFDAQFQVGAQSYEGAGDRYSVAGMVNLPATDDLAFRFAGYYEDHSGNVKNIVPGGGDSGHEYSMLRGALAWQLTENVDIDLMAMFTDESQGLDEAVPAGVWDTDTVATFFLNDPANPTYSSALDDGQGFWPNNRTRTAHTAIGEKTDITSTIVIGKLNWQLGNVDLHWINGVIDMDREKIFDNDLVPEDLVNRYEANESTSWSSELRAAWNTDRVDFTFGVLYSEDEIKGVPLAGAPGGSAQGGIGVVTGTTAAVDGGVFLGPVPGDGNRWQFQGGPGIVDFSGTGALPPVADLTGMGLAPPGGLYLWQIAGGPTPDGDWPLCLGCSIREFNMESYAAFGDLTWRASDRVNVIVGGRFTSDKVSPKFTGYGLWRLPRVADPGDPTGMTPVTFTNSKTYDDFSPRVVLEFMPNDDVRVYGNVSKGYKAGGFSLDFNSAGGAPNGGEVNNEFKEEELWNYEIGVKSSLYDNRLRLNASVFYLDWSNFQYETFFFTVPGDASSNVSLTRNIKDAEASGLEVEFAGAVSEYFTLSGGVGLLSTEITSNDTAEISGNLTMNLKGQPLPRSPDMTANMVGEFSWPLRGDDQAYLRFEWTYRDDSFSTIEDVTYLQSSNAPVLLDTTLPPGPGNTVAVVPDRSDGYPFIAPAHHVWNLRAGTSWNRNWEVNVYVENLFDENYFTGAGDNFGLSGFRLRPSYRSFGLNLTYNYAQR